MPKNDDDNNNIGDGDSVKFREKTNGTADNVGFDNVGFDNVGFDNVGFDNVVQRSKKRLDSGGDDHSKNSENEGATAVAGYIEARTQQGKGHATRSVNTTAPAEKSKALAGAKLNLPGQLPYATMAKALRKVARPDESGWEWKEVLVECPPKKTASTSLGGYPNKNLSALPFYASLDRSRPLTAWKNSHELSEIHPYLGKVVNTLFDKGTLWVRWSLPNPKYFAIKMFDSGLTATKRTKDSNGLGMICFDFGWNCDNEFRMDVYPSPFLKKHLVESDYVGLLVRAAHLFLRQSGHLLGDIFVLGKSCQELELWYVKMHQFKSKLDISMVLADALVCFQEIPAMKTRHNQTITHALNRVGESLECLSRFKEAAQVYEETTHAFCVLPCKNDCEKCLCL